MQRFLGQASTWEALAAWLGLVPGDASPARHEIVARLTWEIAAIDDLLGGQLDRILHHPSFQALEAAWRGLYWLVGQVDDDGAIQVRVLNASWRDLSRDLERAIEFDQSQLFRKVYSAEFGIAGGEPFGVLLGNYSVRHRPTREHPSDDIATLRSIAQVAAAAFAPFVAAAHSEMFGLDSFAELERPVDFGAVFRSPEYVKWNALRDTEDSRFVGLALPRVLMRLPWHDDPTRADGFRYVEDTSVPDGSGYLWGNPAFAYGAVVLRSFADTGWLASVRGVERDVEGGGLVTTLPRQCFETDRPGLIPKPSTEVLVSDLLEKELEELGFLPLCHARETPFEVFYSSQSIQRPRSFDEDAANVNAKLSSMLHYMLCASRFAHYLKVIGRDKVGSFATAEECENYLNNWLIDYSTASEDASSELRARYPLSEARVTVRERPGRPGQYSCVVHLRPHFQLDQLTSSIQLVTELTSGSE